MRLISSLLIRAVSLILSTAARLVAQESRDLVMFLTRLTKLWGRPSSIATSAILQPIPRPVATRCVLALLGSRGVRVQGVVLWEGLSSLDLKRLHPFHEIVDVFDLGEEWFEQV